MPSRVRADAMTLPGRSLQRSEGASGGDRQSGTSGRPTSRTTSRPLGPASLGAGGTDSRLLRSPLARGRQYQKKAAQAGLVSSGVGSAMEKQVEFKIDEDKRP